METMYKETKIKATMRLATDVEDRMVAVRKFDLHRIERNRSSLIKDGINYALDDFNIKLVVSEEGFEATFERDGGEKTTDNKLEVTKETSPLERTHP